MTKLYKLIYLSKLSILLCTIIIHILHIIYSPMDYLLTSVPIGFIPIKSCIDRYSIEWGNGAPIFERDKYQ